MSSLFYSAKTFLYPFYSKKLNWYIVLLISLSFLSANQVQAQHTISIKGIVNDPDTHDPVSAVTVSWKNKGVGSITNTDGRFVIIIPDDYTPVDSLTFSCIGYHSQNLAIQLLDRNKTLTVSLNRETGMLKEVSVRPLGLKQLLDSISKHNLEMFIPQMALRGYYREFVYTNVKCTAYADALCEYDYNKKSLPEGQMHISASRCFKEKKVNNNKDNMEVYKESNLNPNTAFSYSLLSAMLEKYFPAKSLDDYIYRIEEHADKDSDHLKIVIHPRNGATDALYQLTFDLTEDYTLLAYHLEIPDGSLSQIKEKNLLGIHSKITATHIDVKYTRMGDNIYPSYYSIYKSAKIWGKFLGTTIDQSVINKSEFLVSAVTSLPGTKTFSKQDIYKKGNICSNGAAMNDQMLQTNTIIIPSAAEAKVIENLMN